MSTARKAGRRPASAETVGRQEIWAAIRGFGQPFSLEELLNKTGADRKTAQDYLRCLLPGGVVAQASDGCFTLVDDRGFHAPRLNRAGKPVTQGAGVENMWRSMRMLAQFSFRDIVAHSTTDAVTISDTTAKTYCGMLLRCGYLRVVQKADTRGRAAIYRLIRNSGPQPPMIQRIKVVYDPNLKTVFEQVKP